MYQKKLGELYAFLKNNNHKEAALLKSYMRKIAITLDESKRDFQGYLYCQVGGSEFKVKAGDYEGHAKIVETLKSNPKAEAYIVYTASSTGTPIHHIKLYLKDDKLYGPPYELADRDDNILEYIHDSPYFAIEDSVALDDHIHTINWPQASFDDYGRSMEHYNVELYNQLAQLALERPEGMQDFVNGYYEAAEQGYWNTDLSQKSDDFVAGFMSRQSMDSEGDVISGDSMWNAESTPAEKKYHRYNLSRGMQWGEEYQASGEGRGHDTLANLLMSGRIHEIEGFSEAAQTFDSFKQRVEDILIQEQQAPEGYYPRTDPEDVHRSMELFQSSLSEIRGLVQLITRMSKIKSIDQRVLGRYIHVLMQRLSGIQRGADSVVRSLYDLKKADAFYAKNVEQYQSILPQLVDRGIDTSSFEESILMYQQKRDKIRAVCNEIRSFADRSFEQLLSSEPQQKLLE